MPDFANFENITLWKRVPELFFAYFVYGFPQFTILMLLMFGKTSFYVCSELKASFLLNNRKDDIKFVVCVQGLSFSLKNKNFHRCKFCVRFRCWFDQKNTWSFAKTWNREAKDLELWSHVPPSKVNFLLPFFISFNDCF